MNLLSIGGSDPSGGAGIQSDIKTFEGLKVHGLSIVTAITAQNTTRLSLTQSVSKKILKEQLKMIFSDFKIEGIKISMVYNSHTIKTIYRELKDKKIPIVVDPVINSTTGAKLLKKNAIKNFKNFIIPLATVITPNKNEAELLTQIKIKSKKDLPRVAKKIQSLGAKNVIITGMEERDKILDFVLEEDKQYFISGTKISKINHGSGCNYSAVIIYAISSRKSIKESSKIAKKYAFESIKNAKKIGKGVAITQNRNTDSRINKLDKAISKLITIDNIYKQIPECQTNFVFSKKFPKAIEDVLGVEGRIVKTGTKVVVAGNLKYGGSKHVASALLVMNNKFPSVCSAINLKYQVETISKFEKQKFKITSYDRIHEPKKNKEKEGLSVEWGINLAIKNLKTPPDIVYHKGDFGKEPMIIIFGKTPLDILNKISKITSS